MKQIIPTFEEFLNEGGWATVKTQDTVITPDIIAECVKIMKRIEGDFNKHLVSINLPELDFSQPIGSGTWWEEDLQKNPDKTYGDIDYMISYPILDLTNKNSRKDEIATVKLYNEELFNWLRKTKPKNIDVEESIEISSPSSAKLLIKLDNNKYVQVDLVVTHTEYKDWAIFRFTPERGIKGFVIGKMYTALGYVLEISIQPRGVRAKFVKNIMVPFSKRKDTEEKLISLSAETFIYDIAKFFWEQSSDEEFLPSTTLSKWKGIDPKSPKLKDLCDGIIGLADTLEQLGEFGTVIKYKSSKEFLDALVDKYEDVMGEATTSSKFKKAQTPAAFVMIEKIKKIVGENVAKAKEYLK